jgi:hypothetical protein
MNRDPGDVHPAALEMDEKQHVVGHQPAQREHLRGEEVGPDQQRQVDPDECRPSCRALAFWCRRQAMTLQDVADRLIADLVPQIGQRPHNPVIAPVTIFPRHPNDQLLNFSLDLRPAGASTSFRAIEFAGHELAVPSQDGVRPGDIGHLAENLAAQSMTDCSMRSHRSFRLSRGEGRVHGIGKTISRFSEGTNSNFCTAKVATVGDQNLIRRRLLSYQPLDPKNETFGRS